MSYQDVFGGQLIYPSEMTFLRLDMNLADVTLFWPVEQAIAGVPVVADIIEVFSDLGSPYAVTMPSAEGAGPGQSTLFNNVGTDTIDIYDAGGNVIVSVASGEAWQVYLEDNTTPDGVWRTFQFGAGVSNANAAALAGPGLKAISTVLALQITPEEESASPYAVLSTDRCKAKIWTGGLGTFDLPDPADMGFGTDWFFYVRNSGSGTLTLDTAAGYINDVGETTFLIPPGASAIVVSAGTFWFTLVGGGSSGTSDFDFTSINVGGGAGDYTLSGAELNRIAYRFTGVLTGNRAVIVPGDIQQYWVNNQTVGAFTLEVKTSTGVGVIVPQGRSIILYSDGNNVIAAVGSPTTGVGTLATADAPLVTTLGGTGVISYVQGDILYASGTNTLTTLPKNTDATRYLSNAGTNNNPVWASVDLSNGVVGILDDGSLSPNVPLLDSPANFTGGLESGGEPVGFLNTASLDFDGNLTLTDTHKGRVLLYTGTGGHTVTYVNSLADGVISVVHGGSGNLTFAASGATLRLAGTTATGSRVVGPHGMATFSQQVSGTVYINGVGFVG